jgi:hypothetical protein
MVYFILPSLSCLKIPHSPQQTSVITSLINLGDPLRSIFQKKTHLICLYDNDYAAHPIRIPFL